MEAMNTEVVRVTDGSLIQIQTSARDSERRVWRSVAAHIRITQLELANSYRSIVVRARIVALSGCLAGCKKIARATQANNLLFMPSARRLL